MKPLILIVVANIFILTNYYCQSFGIKSINLETYQNISYNRISNQNENSSAFHSNDRVKYGYSYSIGTNFFESERIALTSAISYTNIGFSSKKNEATFGDQIDPQTGFATINTQSDNYPYYTKYYYRFNYIDLNIGVNYFISTNKTKIYAHFSPEFNYLLNFKHITKTYNFKNKKLDKDVDDRTESSKIAPTNFSINGGFGLEFNVFKGINLYTQLNYKQMLLSSIPEAITQDKFYSYGIKVGLRYILN